MKRTLAIILCAVLFASAALLCACDPGKTAENSSAAVSEGDPVAQVSDVSDGSAEESAGESADESIEGSIEDPNEGSTEESTDESIEESAEESVEESVEESLEESVEESVEESEPSPEDAALLALTDEEIRERYYNLACRVFWSFDGLGPDYYEDDENLPGEWLTDYYEKDGYVRIVSPATYDACVEDVLKHFSRRFADEYLFPQLKNIDGVAYVYDGCRGTSDWYVGQGPIRVVKADAAAGKMTLEHLTYGESEATEGMNWEEMQYRLENDPSCFSQHFYTYEMILENGIWVFDTFEIP